MSIQRGCAIIRTAVILLVLLLTGPVIAQPKPGDQASGQGDPVSLFDAQDEAMNAAIAEALASLPAFLENAFTSDGHGLPDSMLKISLPSASGGGNEIIWVHGLTQTATGFAGYLANAPVDLGPLRQGDYVEFQASQINDWATRAPSGRLYGHFTTRVIAALPGNAYLWDLLEPVPIPPTWR